MPIIGVVLNFSMDAETMYLSPSLNYTDSDLQRRVCPWEKVGAIAKWKTEPEILVVVTPVNQE